MSTALFFAGKKGRLIHRRNTQKSLLRYSPKYGIKIGGSAFNDGLGTNDLQIFYSPKPFDLQK
ncbi:MAG: hypothetical protein WDM76_08605 [Limisphaerales bacterium]